MTWRSTDAGGAIAATFDERDDAVKAMLAMAITACRKAGKYAGICGQGPWIIGARAGLVEQHIEISLNPEPSSIPGLRWQRTIRLIAVAVSSIR